MSFSPYGHQHSPGGIQQGDKSPCCTHAALYGGAGLTLIAKLLRSGKCGIGTFGETLDIAFWAKLPEGCKLGMFLNRMDTESNN